MNFRPATLDDTVHIARMLRTIYGRKGGVYGIPYDHESCMSEVAQTIHSGISLIGKGCCAGALILPFPYNHAAMVAQVVYWYVASPRTAPGLLACLMEKCKSAGASHLNVASIGPDFAGKRFYNHRGLAHAESHFLGPLSDYTLKSDCKAVGSE